jgi:hypothetical protein
MDEVKDKGVRIEVAETPFGVTLKMRGAEANYTSADARELAALILAAAGAAEFRERNGTARCEVCGALLHARQEGAGFASINGFGYGCDEHPAAAVRFTMPGPAADIMEARDGSR